MKSRHLPLAVVLTAVIALLASYLILRDKENAREQYEKYLLERGKEMNAGSQQSAVGSQSNSKPETRNSEPDKSFDEPQMAAFQDFLQTMDPKEKRVPVERLYPAYEQLKASHASQSLKRGIALNWDIVPSNMGGRTRCIMYDPNDAGIQGLGRCCHRRACGTTTTSPAACRPGTGGRLLAFPLHQQHHLRSQQYR